ncbi:lipoyltransferase [Piedraia hortae CBS 480.64]|uniref:Octanoyltransferase n=1 Tax=Piedraia hortae CBS 480.64 TaxID=1314780 RepID=A0A6A7C1U4_9PEZI|nr:lipoyltransferase [Piedraia hortae CBS 480.64]
MLRHAHLGLTSYAHANELQQRLVGAMLAHKADPLHSPPVPPTVLTAEFHPVYTCGRREIGTVSAKQQAYLTSASYGGEQAEFYEAARGGQTTFHGPGQLVAYPILDLRRLRLASRDYVRMLEETAMETCARHRNIQPTRLPNHPGVWIRCEGSETKKICALGLHLRRHISSHGIGLNVSTDLRWFSRIQACGLDGRLTTSLVAEGITNTRPLDEGIALVERLASRLAGVHDVEDVNETELFAY